MIATTTTKAAISSALIQRSPPQRTRPRPTRTAKEQIASLRWSQALAVKAADPVRLPTPMLYWYRPSLTTMLAAAIQSAQAGGSSCWTPIRLIASQPMPTADRITSRATFEAAMASARVWP